MRPRMFVALLSVMSLFFSPLVFAHISKSPEGWTGIFLHPFTGADHLLMLVFLGIAIAYFIRKSRQPDE
jgi:hydrogenase/urease accessory protein HupE